MKKRHHNGGLRKACGCPRRKWAKCPHPWHFNYKVRGGQDFRFSLDREFGRHIASKTEAAELAEGIRIKIRSGTFRRGLEQPTPSSPTRADQITFARVGEAFLERFDPPRARDRAAWVRQTRAHLRQIGAAVVDGRPLADMPIGVVTADTLESVIADLRARRAASTVNHYIQVTKQMCGWVAKKGYIDRDPVVHGANLRRRKGAKRERRTTDDEVARLLAAAGPRLQWMILAGLETACRSGELLSLQMKDVDLARREITIRAEKAKDNETRTLPISDRLLAVLEMARFDVADRPLPPDGYPFGDGTGRRVTTIKRAWDTCKLKAYGYTPKWIGGGKLAPESRAALKAINLRFHDLRHEAGSTFAEQGWPLHHVQAMLGHASLQQTSTYLNVTRTGLHESMRKFGTGTKPEPVANRLQKATAVPPAAMQNGEPMTSAKTLVN